MISGRFEIFWRIGSMRQILISIALVFLLPSSCFSETADVVMEKVWTGYFGSWNYSEYMKAEVENKTWGNNKKDLYVQINYSSGEALFFIGSARRFSGTLFVPGNDFLGFDVLVNPNGRRVKKKNEDYNTGVSGTEFWYFDLARLIRMDKVKYQFAGSAMDIKATPQKHQGDYEFMIFRLDERKQVITNIEYYRSRKRVKIQVNENIRWLKLEDQKIWRPGKIRVISNEGFTELEIKERKFFRFPLEINKKALEKGRP